MKPHTLLVVFALAVSLLMAADDKAKESRLTDNDLSMEVSALQAMHFFQLTPEQMKRLQKMAPETAEKLGSARAAAKVSAEYRTTMERLRDALVKANDEEL